MFYPRIKDVKPLKDYTLIVAFDNGQIKKYDMRPLIAMPPFDILKDPLLFSMARVEAGGYGISWSDDLDLSEYELWEHGELIANADVPPEG
ncbi:hypothetical protein MTAT_18120 [Moorella thermoacetica]|uniref:DUF2442 domain-containing protein n=1 Tax=Neomoorella thermoacetica TaxID=1525 RepID=A0A1D7X8S8_NEOTH|nr:DUF2442 domain-containing protein [Moorella thermoacetica]AOQ23282.1 hypothetical protein Maut_00820 [Moorella thermoacetica]OIQ08196.1 hypothetical protein MOOR_21660 [Moorella thermoacetica]TYL12988.1 hypothetical protein MTAT_18120 [Moorella thermoacetica]